MQAYRQLILTALLPLLLLPSCKDKNDTRFANEDERTRLEAYQEVHFGGRATRLGEGAFSVALKEGAGETIGTSGWLLFDYVAKDLDGRLLATSLRDTAKQYGLYRASEPYEPFLRPIQEGLFYDALRGQKVGAELLLATPSYVAYPKELWRAPRHTSVLCTLIPRALVEDPVAREERLINDYLLAHPTQSYERIDERYYRWIEKEGEGGVVGADYTSYVFYEGYLLSGFLVETNSRELALQHGVPVAANGSVLQLDYLSEKNLIPLFRGLTQGLKIGTVFHVIAASQQAYGQDGERTIQPHTPLHYRISLTNALPIR